MNKTFALYITIAFGNPMIYLGRDSFTLTSAFKDHDFYVNPDDKKYCFLNCGKNIGNLPARHFYNTLSFDYIPYAENF